MKMKPKTENTTHNLLLPTFKNISNRGAGSGPSPKGSNVSYNISESEAEHGLKTMKRGDSESARLDIVPGSKISRREEEPRKSLRRSNTSADVPASSNNSNKLGPNLRKGQTREVKRNALEEETTDKYKCDFCHEKFFLKMYLEDHLTLHRNDDDYPYSCSVCGECYQTEAELSEHFSESECRHHQKQLGLQVQHYSGAKSNTNVDSSETTSIIHLDVTFPSANLSERTSSNSIVPDVTRHPNRKVQPKRNRSKAQPETEDVGITFVNEEANQVESVAADNKSERLRRRALTDSMISLKNLVPSISKVEKCSKVQILTKAASYCRELKATETHLLRNKKMLVACRDKNQQKLADFFGLQ